MVSTVCHTIMISSSVLANIRCALCSSSSPAGSGSTATSASAIPRIAAHGQRRNHLQDLPSRQSGKEKCVATVTQPDTALCSIDVISDCYGTAWSPRRLV
jgi:hypothetical protein